MWFCSSLQTRYSLRDNDMIWSGCVLYLPPNGAGRDGEGRTPHPTASQTPEHLRTDSECQGTDCGHSTAEWN